MSSILGVSHWFSSFPSENHSRIVHLQVTDTDRNLVYLVFAFRREGGDLAPLSSRYENTTSQFSSCQLPFLAYGEASRRASVGVGWLSNAARGGGDPSTLSDFGVLLAGRRPSPEWYSVGQNMLVIQHRGGLDQELDNVEGQ